MKNYYVYVLTNKPLCTLYIGMTNNLVRRGYEHRNGLIDGFTKNMTTTNIIDIKTRELINTVVLPSFCNILDSHVWLIKSK